MGKKLAVSVILREPKTGEVKTFLAGEDVPKWANLTEHFVTGEEDDEEPREPETPEANAPGGSGEGGADGVESPAKNASLEDWRSYAVSQGANESDVAEATRADLIAKYGEN